MSLHRAAANGNLKVVEKLILNGAKVNEKDNVCRTPLHYAAFNGKLEVVRELLEYGAIHNEKNNNGKTPLDIATNEEIIEYLTNYHPLFDAKEPDVE